MSSKRAEPGQPHLEIITLCSLPWRDAWLLAARLREEGVRASVPDYEATFREWEQTLFPVLVEKRQAEQARRIAGEYLKR